MILTCTFATFSSTINTHPTVCGARVLPTAPQQDQLRDQLHTSSDCRARTHSPAASRSVRSGVICTTNVALSSNSTRSRLKHLGTGQPHGVQFLRAARPARTKSGDTTSSFCSRVRHRTARGANLLRRGWSVLSIGHRVVLQACAHFVRPCAWLKHHAVCFAGRKFGPLLTVVCSRGRAIGRKRRHLGRLFPFHPTGCPARSASAVGLSGRGAALSDLAGVARSACPARSLGGPTRATSLPSSSHPFVGRAAQQDRHS